MSNYLSSEEGKLSAKKFISTSDGADDAGKAVVTGPQGILDASLLPASISATNPPAYVTDTFGSLFSNSGKLIII